MFSFSISAQFILAVTVARTAAPVNEMEESVAPEDTLVTLSKTT